MGPPEASRPFDAARAPAFQEGFGRTILGGGDPSAW